MIRSPLMTVMTDAVMKASRSLKRDFGEVENLQVSRKGPGDFVSAADRKAEKILRDALEKARPGYGFVMEEERRRRRARTRAIAGISIPSTAPPTSCTACRNSAISVGLERDGQMVAGVIYDPAKDELFIAEKGKGAYLNNRRIRVAARSEMADARRGLRHAAYRQGRSRPFPARGRGRDGACGRHAPLRRGGARSRLRRLRPHRCLLGTRPQLAGISRPGCVLIREAGGFVSDADGGSDPLATGIGRLRQRDHCTANCSSCCRQAKRVAAGPEIRLGSGAGRQ